MDRLEKALEKSRQQRAATLSQNQPSAEDLKKMSAHTVSAEGAVPVNADLLDENRIVAHRIRSSEADVYRQLRTKVLQIMTASGFKTLAITSPNYGDGKTTVAVNLGVSIAQDLKQTVLLADLDLRKPSLHKYMGLESQTGLADYLLNNTPLSDCLTRPSFDRISVLPGGSALDKSSELLGSPKMIALAKELKSRYPDRLVIYDMPPVLAQDDSIAFMPMVDAVLVIVRDGVTKIDDLKRCLDALKSANVIGTVLNNCW